MLIRTRFVTNSSTSSFLIYGIALSYDELDRLMWHLRKQNEELFMEQLVDHADETLENVKERLDDDETYRDILSYNVQEFLEEILPERIEIFVDDYDIFLGINAPLETEVCPDGRVAFTHITARDHERLQDLAEAINAKDRKIGFTHWARSDY